MGTAHTTSALVRAGHLKSPVRHAAILLVEDNALIRMMIAGMLEELGHQVVAEAGRFEEARRLAETAEFDIALLDIKLDHKSVAPVAEVIEKRGLPFLFAHTEGAAYQKHSSRNRF